jgi:alkyldihydroxyacetonephosphate synthase
MQTNLPGWIDSLRGLIGPERVSSDRADLVSHSFDAWPVAAKWRQQGKQPYQPDVVVRPVDTVEVSRLLAWASQNHVPVTPWGAGSSVTGAPLPLHGGISLDLSAMSRLLALDETNLLVKVEAGMRGQVLEAELNARGYTLNHSPQSLHRSSVGGWIATRATGQFSSRWGGIEELVVALTVVLPGGEIVETKLAPRAAIGPDLKQIFIGSEGTLGVVTEATLKIFPLAEQRLFEAVLFDNVEAGLTAMRKIMRASLRPFLVRFYDEDESRHVIRAGSFTGCVMFLGFEGLAAVAQAEYEAGMVICRAEGGEAMGADAVLAWMERRFDFSVVENILDRPGGFAETIETAHLWSGILPTYHALKEALLPLADEVLGHFSHAYTQGTSLYVILLGEAADAAAAEQRLQHIWELSMRICLEQGAVTSHHHGVGLARLPYIRQDLASGSFVLDRIKQALDPAGIMSPGKLGLVHRQC